MTLSVVETEPVCSKPPEGIGLRISRGERRRFSTSVPLSTRASSMFFSVASEGLAESPKLV